MSKMKELEQHIHECGGNPEQWLKKFEDMDLMLQQCDPLCHHADLTVKSIWKFYERNGDCFDTFTDYEAKALLNIGALFITKEGRPALSSWAECWLNAQYVQAHWGSYLGEEPN